MFTFKMISLIIFLLSPYWFGFLIYCLYYRPQDNKEVHTEDDQLDEQEFHGIDALPQRVFERYVENVFAYVNHNLIYNPYRDVKEEPNEKLMRSIEEEINISETSVDDFRREISSYIGAILFRRISLIQQHVDIKLRQDDKPLTWRCHPLLAKALELHLLSKIKNSYTFKEYDVQKNIDSDLKRSVDTCGNIKYYNKLNQLHREDGPAIERADGSKFWYINGKLHREDGPAIEYTDGSKSWYINHKLYREDGPAIELANGYTKWYINDQKLTEQEFNDRNSRKEVDEKGTIRYYNNVNQLHREDGPAIEYADGSKSWCINGQYHREDGPAVESIYGSKSWYINGISLSKEEFNERQNNVKIS